MRKNQHVASGDGQGDSFISAAEPFVQAVLDGSPIPAFVIDREHVVTHWNHACEEMTGVTASEIVGQPSPSEYFYAGQNRSLMADLVLEEDAEGIVDLYAGRAVERGRLGVGSYEAVDVLHIAGRERTVYFVATAIRAAGGHIVGAIETLQDISSVAAVERELRERTEQLEQANHLLAGKNAALHELMSSMHSERDKLASVLSQNMERLVFPLLHQLRQGLSGRQAETVDSIEASLRELTSPLLKGLAEEFLSLTPKELRICALVRRGLSSKEIARLECVSPETVKTHRQRIRRKLGIAKGDVNLATYLQHRPLDGRQGGPLGMGI